MAARCGLRALLALGWLGRPSSAALVCDACQALASAALRHLREPSSAPGGLVASLEGELREGGPAELQRTALHAGLPRERLVERCGHFLLEDRPALARLSRAAAAGAGAAASSSWGEVRDELCVRRLRCHPGGVWATPEPWAAAAEAAGTPAEPPGSGRGEVKGEAGSGSSGVGSSQTTYERMLSEYGAAAGSWEEPRAAPASPPRDLKAEVGEEASQDAGGGRAAEADAPEACGAGAGGGEDGGCDAAGSEAAEAPPPGPSPPVSAAGSRAPRHRGAPSVAAEEGSEDDGPEDPLEPKCGERRDSYKDLASVRIVVVVFCGRRDRLRILLRYLRRDLRRSGGVVDHVILARWQHSRRDLDFIERIVAQDGGNGTFETRDFSEETWGPARDGADPSTNRMVRLYQSLDEPDTVYVKIDDDVVYVAPHAIANVVREVRRGRCLLVSANVVNHAIMSSLHQDRGAHRGFWPSAEQRRQPSRRLPWQKRSAINLSPNFQFERHPVARCVVERWDCAALVHESFLDRAADGTLCAFDFGWHDFNRGGFREHRYVHRSPSINKEYPAEGARWSTNFFAFTRASLDGVNWQAIYGKGDDEEEFTGPHAQRREEHSCAVGAALTVHFSYGSQEEGLMANTDLLRRYDKLSRKLVPSALREAKPARGRKRSTA